VTKMSNSDPDKSAWGAQIRFRLRIERRDDLRPEFVHRTGPAREGQAAPGRRGNPGCWRPSVLRAASGGLPLRVHEPRFPLRRDYPDSSSG
jgi:hypothetical protein